MAFGFRREPGSGRGYVNETNPDFALGQRLSRRQYDKYVEKLGKRKRLPGVNILREAEQRLRQIQDELDELRRESVNLAERERRVSERERLVAERERNENLRSQAHRRARQNAGQRRYNTLLDAYVSERRRRGDTSINKRSAAQSPEFKQIVRDVKGTKNPSHNPNVAARNAQRRRDAFNKLGGAMKFKEQYEEKYGVRIRPAYGPVNNAGRSSFTPRGGYTVRRRVA